MSDHTDKNETVSAKYAELKDYLCDMAMKLAEDTRKEQAGETELLALQQKITRLSAGVDHLRALAASEEKPTSLSALDLIQNYATATAKHSNVASTNIPLLNRMLGGGFEPSTLVFLLGAPGAGKTALANQFADHIANQKRPVCFLTAEDTPHKLLSKTIARLGKINYTAVRKGQEDYLERIHATLAEYAERPSARWLRYIDATANRYTLESIIAEAQTHFDTGKPGEGFLVVDYLQKLARYYAPDKDIRVSVTRFAEELRLIAMRLNCCVLALASQSRVGIKGPVDLGSLLTSGKESGDIEYSADVLMVLTEDQNRIDELPVLGRPPMKPRILAVAKNRLEDTGTVNLNWTGAWQRFDEVGEEEE